MTGILVRRRNLETDAHRENTLKKKAEIGVDIFTSQGTLKIASKPLEARREVLNGSLPHSSQKKPTLSTLGF